MPAATPGGSAGRRARCRAGSGPARARSARESSFSLATIRCSSAGTVAATCASAASPRSASSFEATPPVNWRWKRSRVSRKTPVVAARDLELEVELAQLEVGLRDARHQRQHDAAAHRLGGEHLRARRLARAADAAPDVDLPDDVERGEVVARAAELRDRGSRAACSGRAPRRPRSRSPGRARSAARRRARALSRRATPPRGDRGCRRAPRARARRARRRGRSRTTAGRRSTRPRPRRRDTSAARAARGARSSVRSRSPAERARERGDRGRLTRAAPAPAPQRAAGRRRAGSGVVARCARCASVSTT